MSVEGVKSVIRCKWNMALSLFSLFSGQEVWPIFSPSQVGEVSLQPATSGCRRSRPFDIMAPTATMAAAPLPRTLTGP